jgi:hypothetical protein
VESASKIWADLHGEVGSSWGLLAKMEVAKMVVELARKWSLSSLSLLLCKVDWLVAFASTKMKDTNFVVLTEGWRTRRGRLALIVLEMSKKDSRVQEGLSAASASELTITVNNYQQPLSWPPWSLTSRILCSDEVFFPDALVILCGVSSARTSLGEHLGRQARSYENRCACSGSEGIGGVV